jgi:hypothetical protein
VESSKLLDLISSSPITPISFVSFENKLWFLFNSNSPENIAENIEVKSPYDTSSLKVTGKVIQYDPETKTLKNLNLEDPNFVCDGIYLKDKELILSGSIDKDRAFLNSPDFKLPKKTDTDCIAIFKDNSCVIRHENNLYLLEGEIKDGVLKFVIEDKKGLVTLKNSDTEESLQETDLIKILAIKDSKIYFQLESKAPNIELCVIDTTSTDTTHTEAKCSITTPSLYAQLQNSLFFIIQNKLNIDDYYYTSIESLQLNYFAGNITYFPTQESIPPQSSDNPPDPDKKPEEEEVPNDGVPDEDGVPDDDGDSKVPHATRPTPPPLEPFDGYYFYYIGIFVILCVTMGVLLRRYCQKPTSIENNGGRMNLSSLLRDPSRKETTKDNDNENI